MTNPIRALLYHLAESAVGKALSEGRAGKDGPVLQKVLAAIDGKKTLLGVLLWALTIAFTTAGTPAWAETLSGTVATAMLSWGLLDKSYKAFPPAWTQHPVYLFLQAHVAWMSLLTSVIGAELSACAAGTAEFLARFGMTCVTGRVVFGCVVAILIQAGFDLFAALPPWARNLVHQSPFRS